MGNELIAALRDELHDVVKYCDMAKRCEYGSILTDIAAEEMQHAKNIKSILEMSGEVVPDMSEDWAISQHALFEAQ